ncbi:MAG: flagellar hook-associated protein FlgK [Anaerolineae bacterium]
MSTIFGSLNTALRALQTMQRSIDVTGHNVANAATPGYSRQKTLLSAGDPYSVPALNRQNYGQVGTGVTIEKVQRYRANFLDTQIRQETLMQKGWEVRRDALQQVEVAFNEPSDTAMSGRLGEFWNAWNNLATSPDSSATRAHVAETAAAFSASMRETYRQLSNFQGELDDRIAMQVQQVNDLAHRIADLNGSIRMVQSISQQPNDLRDERDKLLTELSGIVEVDSYEDENGAVTVSLGGRWLVSDQSVSELGVEPDPANTQASAGLMLNRVIWAKSGDVAQINGIALEGGLPSLATERLRGELGGALIARDLLIPDKLNQLDEMANTLIGAVNNLHQTGYGLDGTSTGGDFFSGTGARDIALSNYISADYNRIATAGTANSLGDGSKALSIAQLQNSLLMKGGTTTIGDFYRATVVSLGQEAQQASTMTQSHELLTQHLQSKQDEIAGVSLDEEMTYMLQYQRTYQAAARMMTTVDEMLDKVVNGMGVVGR